MRVTIRFALILLGLVLGARSGGADDLAWSAPLAVARVPAGDRVELADGRTVRLAGIRLPAGPGAQLTEQAQATLAGLLAGQAVRLGTAAAPVDRYGELVAQVERADGTWLQGALLEQGLAEVETRPGEVLRAAEMLALERVARNGKRGLWADPTFAPRSAERVADAIGSFQIVQGRVLRVASTHDYVYLNFGRDWRSDFTLRLRRAELDDRFERSGLDVLALAGRRIEVRGFVLEAGGPLIELSHPEQIQILP
jgi:endonuclease YncB( thermonuclease family)